ncbi:glycosyltransferase [Dissulfurispira sp.]|uniref:glycosyltransferase n=1 Tax=Dissulfurispira sp. TaxID=2817609 RepID=UPI002FD940FB
MQDKCTEESDVLMVKTRFPQVVGSNLIAWDKIRNTLQSVNDEDLLLKSIDEILKMNEDGSAPIEIVKLLREKVFSIFIGRLKFHTNLFALYPLFNSKKFELAPHEGMFYIKNKLLDEHYEKADNISKEAILILVLLIDILNQRRDKGLKDFITRYADINCRVKEFAEIVKVLNVSPGDIVDIYIESGIFSPNIFMGKTIDTQKNNLLFLHRIFSEFNAPNHYVRLYEPLKTLFYESIKARNIELVLYIGFFIRFYYGNFKLNVEAWKRLDDEVERPMSDFFVRYCKENNILPCNKKIRVKEKIKVGYAYQRLILSSPVLVFLSLLKGHYLNKNTDIEFYVYGYDYIEKIGDTEKVINMIESMGFKCISAGKLGSFKNIYHSHFEKAMALRKQIIEDGIDIFITTGTQIGNFLVSSRVAPIQIYWSHGDPYWNVNNLDYRIVHSAEESVIKGLYGGIEYFKFPNLMAMELLNPNVSPEKIDIIRLKFPKDKILLGVFGILPKLNHPDYLFAVSEILKRNPETVFLICGYGDKQDIEEYFKKVGCIDRVYFEGHVNPHIYGHVIDIALDPFPVPMGVASLELQAKGKPMVSFKVNLDEINEFRLKEVLSSSIDEYIQIASKLIKDRNFRNEIGKKYQEFVGKKLDCQKAANGLEILYKNLTEENMHA